MADGVIDAQRCGRPQGIADAPAAKVFAGALADGLGPRCGAHPAVLFNHTAIDASLPELDGQRLPDRTGTNLDAIDSVFPGIEASLKDGSADFYIGPVIDDVPKERGNIRNYLILYSTRTARVAFYTRRRCAAGQRGELEQLCRYVTCPAIAMSGSVSTTRSRWCTVRHPHPIPTLDKQPTPW